MPSTPATSAVACVFAPLPTLDADLILIPWFEDDKPSAVPGLDAALGGEIARAQTAGEFTGKPFDLFNAQTSDRGWKAHRVMFVGAGRLDAYTPDTVRKLAATAGLAARARRATKAAFVIRGGGDPLQNGQAAAEGLTLAEFNGASYKTSDPPPAPIPAWTLAFTDQPGDASARIERAVARGRLLGECSNSARELANEPGNALTPREFARRASALASDAGVNVEILDEHRIAELGMGLLLGVSRGSSEPPRLLVFRHEPPGGRQPGTPVLGLVGKGVTFDTGGISIKPADGMERMKDDMAGGAAVASAMKAISLLQAPIPVIGIVPMTENMPGGRAIKPGDILKSASGKTVEVINTDAEGRLILGDGLWYAQQLGATHLVDVATLTGACIVALGKSTSGLFGTPEKWVEQVRRVALHAGDRVWPLPIFDDYREQLKSDIADISNTGGRPAGAITAALFLKEFAGGLPWVHLDIAGTAWAEESKPWLPKGPSGAAVRTLAELAFEKLES